MAGKTQFFVGLGIAVLAAVLLLVGVIPSELALVLGVIAIGLIATSKYRLMK